MQIAKYIIVVVGFSGLAACGGGGGDTASEVGGFSFNDYVNQEEALDSAADMVPIYSGAEIPTTGEATYAGLLQFGAERGGDDGFLIGQMNITVGFSGAGTASGAVTDIYYADGNTLTPENANAPLPAVMGELTFSNAQINRVDENIDDQLLVDMDGTLVSSVDTWGIAAGTDLAVDGRIDGVMGDGAISGFIDATITPDGGTAFQNEFGGFVAIEQ